MLGHTVDNTSADQQEREWRTGSAVVSIVFVMLGHTTADKTTVIGSCIWARSGQNLCGPVGGTIANRFWSNELVSTVLFLLLMLGGRARTKTQLSLYNKDWKKERRRVFQGSCLREEKNGAPVQLLLFSRLCSCTLPLRCVSVSFLSVEDPFSCR